MELNKTGAELRQSQTTQEHEINVEGTKLREKRVLINFFAEGQQDDPHRVSLVHTRWIGEDHYEVQEVTEGAKVVYRQVYTSLNDDQVEPFLQEWRAKWKPTLDEEAVAQTQAEADQARALLVQQFGDGTDPEGCDPVQPDGEMQPEDQERE